MRLSERPTVAVIGGGFSGLMTALHLLDRPDGPRVRLVEPRPGVGRGAAYAPRNAGHLLNVRAANMSAWPDRPSHFVNWLEQDGEGAAAAFVSRARYGAYLQAMLHARTQAGEAGRLILDADAATGLAPADHGWSLRLAMGRTLRADAVVLAVGNLPPHAPAELSPDALASPAYVADPWSDALERVPDEGLVVLMGAGLTMVDVALRLCAERPALQLLAISRRGLLPRRHLLAGPDASPWSPLAPDTPRGVLRELRERSRREDWRRVVDGLRPRVQELWRGWSLAERKRFLRHLRPWWDVHRHRLAPEVASGLDHLTASGRLRLCAGRLERVSAAEGGLEVTWRPKAARVAQRVRAAALVNCTGPNGDLARSGDPLLLDLQRQGLVRPDACRLGLEVDAHGRLIGAAGQPHPALFAVGPVTRGGFWEITSVPDIRVQAADCAGRVHAALLREPAL